MEHTELKMYAVNAAILAFKENIPSRVQIRKWKNNNIKIALIHPDDERVSGMFRSTDLSEYIDADFFVQENVPMGIPNADADLLGTAIKKLKVPSAKTLLLTDDPQYIQAREKKSLAMTIGIKASAGKRVLYEQGADIVLDSLEDIALLDGNSITLRFSQTLPNFFSGHTKFQSMWDTKKPVFFFDYDGTLAPIVNDPSKAVLTDQMRELLNEMSRIFHVSVVSGRDMDDIKKLIQLDGIIYAGSHGFRISGPDELFMEHEDAIRFLTGLDEIATTLRKTLANEIQGVQIERKRYAIAVHYRNAPIKALKRIKNAVHEITARYPGFKTGSGKKILEVKPSMDWHKGKAVKWILEELGLSYSSGYIPIYLGDDVTDEDAFRTLADEGLGILVGGHNQPSAATYQLKDVGQVGQFMHYIVNAEHNPANY